VVFYCRKSEKVNLLRFLKRNSRAGRCPILTGYDTEWTFIKGILRDLLGLNVNLV
jgi:hypothetical protein